MVHKNLCAEQKMKFSRSLEPNLSEKTVTGDRTWAFQYDQETKCQSLQCLIDKKSQNEKLMP